MNPVYKIFTNILVYLKQHIKKKIKFFFCHSINSVLNDCESRYGLM